LERLENGWKSVGKCVASGLELGKENFKAEYIVENESIFSDGK
jgi:hypothetical protein